MTRRLLLPAWAGGRKVKSLNASKLLGEVAFGLFGNNNGEQL
jgi:hypothetical protein